jgi:hypothetical protein
MLKVWRKSLSIASCCVGSNEVEVVDQSGIENLGALDATVEFAVTGKDVVVLSTIEDRVKQGTEEHRLSDKLEDTGTDKNFSISKKK